MSKPLSNPAAERAVLSGICHYHSDAFLDTADILSPSSFTIHSNQLIYSCLQNIYERDDNAHVDIALIYAAAHNIGCEETLQRPSESEHLKAIIDFPIDLKNVRKCAAQVRKLEIARLLQKQLEDTGKKLIDITGEETITHILGLAEQAVFDFSSLLNDRGADPILIGDDIDGYIQSLIDNPIEQMGFSTGFPAYDYAIGGGLRKATVNIVAARAKCGKTTLGDNIAYHITKELNVPVLNMDTEMLRQDHIARMLAKLTHTKITDIETGKFGKSPENIQDVKNKGKILKDIPYYHENIAGVPFEDQLAIMRRWIAKNVGLKSDGTAKNCVILYDYLKLMSGKDLTSSVQEYQLLGFMMTNLHNFSVRYNIPILCLIQTNRDGLNKETVATASGSDRIIWLCSNFTLFKEKSAEEIAEDGEKNGNRKLVVLAARHGEGMDEGNYINCIMYKQFADILEGKTKFEILGEDNSHDEGFDSSTGGGSPDIPY